MYFQLDGQNGGQFRNHSKTRCNKIQKVNNSAPNLHISASLYYKKLQYSPTVWNTLSERSGEKTSCQRTFYNQSILSFDVILQHDWPIEQCLLHIGVFHGGNEEAMFWSFHPLADKTNNEHLPKPFFKVIRKSLYLVLQLWRSYLFFKFVFPRFTSSSLY